MAVRMMGGKGLVHSDDGSRHNRCNSILGEKRVAGTTASVKELTLRET